MPQRPAEARPRAVGGLARAAWETEFELTCEAAGDERQRPGVVAVAQAADALGIWHPHVRALVSRGGWSQNGEWAPVAFVDERLAEPPAQHKVTRLLQGVGLLSEKRAKLLLSWRPS